MIFLLLYEFSDLLDFRTYQDELHSIKKAIKENIQKLGLHDKKQTVVESRKIGINFLKSQFEHRIKNIENRLKFVDSVAYIYAILWLLSSFLIIGLPKSLSSLLEDSKNYSFLLSIFVFATLLVQSVLKAIAYESGHSKVKNHQECLILLGAMEVTTDLIEEGNLTPNQVLQTQHLREQD
jgi:hypothetical protein